ncbi:helix-turn-helix domain-containing protein [Dactylosporangium fulvum]|uniref:Helix-turn-helix domain-containing protein n=1 Tax=Dactylosporangium fulvum TaxID=53359 RepID=A0ABY5VWY9_9ACTN|nr:helix-turn-helix domain-containing protein [Dactylosporangium fulvum]UWP80306.1 helix-turn-helix domain-containing protein [Dactylosporangium fulvum]
MLESERTASESPDAVISRVARRLLEDGAVDRLQEVSTRRIFEVEPAYAAAGVVIGEVSRATRSTLTLSLARLAGVPAPGSAATAAVDIGRLRADQEIPLAAVQHAFRLDFSVLWPAIVQQARDEQLTDSEALLDGCMQVWSVVESIAEEVADSYRERQRENIDGRADARERAFMELLERGAGATAVQMRCGRILGLPQDGTFIVLTGSLPEDEGLALRRLVSRLAQRRAGGFVGGPLEAISGVLDASAFKPAEIRELLSGLDRGRFGVAEVRGDLGELRRGLHLARVVTESRPAESAGVLYLSDRWLSVLMHSDPVVSSAFVSEVLGPVIELPADVRRQLLDTLSAYVQFDGSIGEIATRKFLHRNTVRKRLDRIETLIGRSLASPADMAKVVTALAWLQETHPGEFLPTFDGAAP